MFEMSKTLARAILSSFIIACSSTLFAHDQTKSVDAHQNMMSYKEIQKEFSNEKAWGLLTSLDLHDCSPTKVRSEADIKKYVKELCKLIDAKPFGETVVVNFGADERIAGFSMTQLIETSLISGHFVNRNNTIYIDVFSCKAYDPAVVAEFTKKFFEAKDMNTHVIVRR